MFFLVYVTALLNRKGTRIKVDPSQLYDTGTKTPQTNFAYLVYAYILHRYIQLSSLAYINKFKNRLLYAYFINPFSAGTVFQNLTSKDEPRAERNANLYWPHTQNIGIYSSEPEKAN